MSLKTNRMTSLAPFAIIVMLVCRKETAKEKNMKPNTKIEISVFGALVISAAIWALAIATSKLVDSFVSEGEPGSGDWSVDEKEYGIN